MKNFQPGGLRNRRDDIGGRPRGDVNKYAPKGRRDEGRPSFSKPFDGKRGGGFNTKDRAPRENKSYPATCSVCGIACDVPFRPDGVKPVLCRDCFSKKNSSATNMSGNRDRFTSNDTRGHKEQYTAKPTMELSSEITQIATQLATLETKVSEILELIKASEKLVTAIPAAAVGETKTKKAVVKKAAKTTTKKVAAKKALKKVATKKVTKKK